MTGDDLLAFTDQLGLATSTAPAAPADRELHLVLFRLGREEYGVPIGLVREIVRVQDVTRVPHAPAQIRGVMNLRGRILPVVELRGRLGLDAAVLTHESRVVVVEVEKRTLGLLVDAVAQVTRVSERLIASPPEEVRSAGAEAVTGVARLGDRLLILLDLARLLGAGVTDSSSPVAP